MAGYTAEERALLVRGRLGFAPGCVVDFGGAEVVGLGPAEPRRAPAVTAADPAAVTVEEAGARRLADNESWVYVCAPSVLELPPAASVVSEFLIKLAPEPGIRAVIRPAPGEFLEGSRIPVCISSPGEILRLRTEGRRWVVAGHAVPPFARVWTFSATARVRSALSRFSEYCSDNGWESSAISCDTRRMLYSASLSGRASTQTDAQQTLGHLHVLLASIDPDFRLDDVCYVADEKE
jgi:hypothetical protein